jgi:hypothetical protein
MTRQPPERPQIGERIGIDVARLGEDIFGKFGHENSFGKVSHDAPRSR